MNSLDVDSWTRVRSGWTRRARSGEEEPADGADDPDVAEELHADHATNDRPQQRLPQRPPNRHVAQDGEAGDRQDDGAQRGAEDTRVPRSTYQPLPARPPTVAGLVWRS